MFAVARKIATLAQGQVLKERESDEDTYKSSELALWWQNEQRSR